MCGICGTVNLNKEPVIDSSIGAMMKKVKHRGPGDEGFFVDNNVGFAMFV